MLTGDVVTMHRMGVNDFLMGYLARFEICGLNIPVFSERIRQAGPGPDIRASKSGNLPCFVNLARLSNAP